MYTTTTVAFARPAYGGFGRPQPTITVLVPWSAQFGAAYQQFVNGGYGSYGGGFPAGGLGGLGGYGGGFGGGLPLGGGFGGGIPLGGGAMPYGGAGLGGYGQSVQGYPIGFGVTSF